MSDRMIGVSNGSLRSYVQRERPATQKEIDSILDSFMDPEFTDEVNRNWDTPEAKAKRAAKHKAWLARERRRVLLRWAISIGSISVLIAALYALLTMGGT